MGKHTALPCRVKNIRENHQTVFPVMWYIDKGFAVPMEHLIACPRGILSYRGGWKSIQVYNDACEDKAGGRVRQRVIRNKSLISIWLLDPL